MSATRASADLSREARRHAAEAVVRQYVAVSMALGLVPLPGVDLLTLTAAQLRMLQRVCQLYGVRFRDNLGKSALSALISALIPVKSSVSLAMFLKLFPGFGHLAGGASVSLLAGALTYASGRVFIAHFERGGTLLDFHPRQMLHHARAEFREGLRILRGQDREEKSAA